MGGPRGGQVKAFVTMFASPEHAQTPAHAIAAVAHDARRRLDYSERQCDSRGAPLSSTPPSDDAAATPARVYAARRQESGIFYDAADLVLPGSAPTLAAQLAELEQEVQAATPVHACFSDARTFSVLLSSWAVVSARLADDGSHICDCRVDRRLAANMSAVEGDKKPRRSESAQAFRHAKSGTEPSEHSLPTCSSGFMTAEFVVVGYGDGQVSLIRPAQRRPSASRFESLFGGESDDPLQVAASVEIASEARHLMINADLDLVAALTATAVHFLSLSSDGLTAVRSVALAAEEQVLSATWVPLKPRTLLVIAKPTARPWVLLSQTIFVAETAVARRSTGNYSTRSTSLASPVRTGTSPADAIARTGWHNSDASRRSPHTLHSRSTVASSPTERYVGQGSEGDTTSSLARSGPGLVGRAAMGAEAAVSPQRFESRMTSPSREMEHLLNLAARRNSLALTGNIVCLAAAAHDPDLLAVSCLVTRGREERAGGESGGDASDRAETNVHQYCEIALVDIRRGNVLRKIDVADVAVSLCFHPGGGLLLMFSSTGLLQIVDMALQVCPLRMRRMRHFGNVCSE
jgi:hypothetical protein